MFCCKKGVKSDIIWSVQRIERWQELVDDLDANYPRYRPENHDRKLKVQFIYDDVRAFHRGTQIKSFSKIANNLLKYLPIY